MWKCGLWTFLVPIKGINSIFLMCFLQNAYTKKYGKKEIKIKFLDLKELAFYWEGKFLSGVSPCLCETNFYSHCEVLMHETELLPSVSWRAGMMTTSSNIKVLIILHWVASIEEFYCHMFPTVTSLLQI